MGLRAPAADGCIHLGRWQRSDQHKRPAWSPGQTQMKGYLSIFDLSDGFIVFSQNFHSLGCANYLPSLAKQNKPPPPKKRNGIREKLLALV